MGSFITDHIGVGLFRYDLKNERFVFVNRALGSILKYPRRVILDRVKFKTIFKDKKEAASFLRELQKRKAVKSYKVRVKRKDKEILWTDITASLVKDTTGNGRVCYIEGIIEDATSFMEMKERLEFERNMLGSLLDNIPDAVYFKDRKNRLIRVNKFYADGLKMKKEQILGKTDFDFFPRDQAKKMFDDDNYVLKTGKPIVGKIERTLLPNGTWNQAVTTKIALLDKKGSIVGTMGITRDITAFSNLEEEKLQMGIEAIRAISRIHELRDPYTCDHSNRVSIMADKIAGELGWSQKNILGMKIVGQLHDIGKIVVPAEILSKPGQLSELEYMVVKQHVQHCYNIIKDLKYPFPMAEAIYQHHERLDGLGYPRGLKKNKIIPAARILAVCDVLEAMTYRRPYREALGLKLALGELKANMGKKYDETVVRSVFRLIRKNKGKPFWSD